MKKNFFKIFDPEIQAMYVILVIFTFLTSILDPYVFWAQFVVLVALTAYFIRGAVKKQREFSRYIKNVTESIDLVSKVSLVSFPLPMVICEQNGQVCWYNPLFADCLGDNFDIYRNMNITDIIEGMDLKSIVEKGKKGPLSFPLNQKVYDVYFNIIPTQKKEDPLISLFFVDQMPLLAARQEIEDRKSVVGLIIVDNYDDIMTGAKEIEKANTGAEIDMVISKWGERLSALVSKLEKDRYLFVLEYPYFNKTAADKFPILERIKEISAGPNKLPATVSIGIGQGQNFPEKFEMARGAIDMALARGGDQVVIRNKEGFTFFGGTAKEHERRTRVKSRVITTALKELMQDCSKVLVMGHRYGDLDCVGAGIGLLNAAFQLDKPAAFVINARSKSVVRLIDMMRALPRYQDVFLTEEQALSVIDRETVLIVVDTSSLDYVESPELIEAAGNVVVIDHHRRGGRYIENTALTYNEPYASSTCEMVAEMLQYFGNVKLAKEEANALLSGIILDTKSFSQKTGIRTFEAASYLKRAGADTFEAGALFPNDIDEFKQKSRFVSQAEMLIDGIALSVWEDENAAFTKETFAQAVDELLTISGVKAAFGIASFDGEVHMSARSYGTINVQLIAEKLGGGGHLTVAGTQIVGKTVAEVKQMLIDAIMENEEPLKKTEV